MEDDYDVEGQEDDFGDTGHEERDAFHPASNTSSGGEFGDDALFADDLWAPLGGDDETALDGEGMSANANEINTTAFEEIAMDDARCAQVQEMWHQFNSTMSSRAAAGEAIYMAVFEATGSLQHLFVTPRAIAAVRFYEGLNSIVSSVDDPPTMKILVETLAFGHMNLDITVPRVSVFRDALLDMFQIELGEKASTKALNAFKALLNYIGGAIIYVKAAYGDRLKILDESWKQANSEQHEKETTVESSRKTADASQPASAPPRKGSTDIPKKATTKRRSKDRGTPSKDKAGQVDEEAPDLAGKDSRKDKEQENQNVPTTFPDMFLFNAAVMGFGNELWMSEVLACFDNIVKNISNSNRLQEECDVLLLRISRVAARHKPNLQDFKSCMLASLRSLLPKSWSTEHEVAWSWLWDTVQRMLLKNMGWPLKWENAYFKFLAKLDEASAFEYRAQVYARFFAMAPDGQNYFKQSNTYLHLIAIKVMEMSLDIFREPVRVTEDITAVGLRHVGYGIPTEFFGPYVSATMEVLRSCCTDELAIEAARWSTGLLAKSMVRTITEGSTIVMKAINVNSKKAIVKAISCAPRGERAQWMLLVAVGTQSISPLAWSIEGGKLEAASALLKDLLTFRADREQYYYGAEELFKRHPDVVKKMCNDAPGLLPELLDGLIWRSKTAINGTRRVNYYIKHLMLDPDGNFGSALDWIAKLNDPTIVTHPVLVLLADLIWARIASPAFLFKNTWFLFTFLVFLVSQSIIGKPSIFEEEVERYAVFACRVFVFGFSLGRLLWEHVRKISTSFANKQVIEVFRRVYMPGYLAHWQDASSLGLTVFLTIMLASEPILHCAIAGADKLFTEECESAQKIRQFPYSTASMLAMYIYYALLFDLAVFSTRFSAYVLACGRMLSEVALFLFAVLAIITMFACGFSSFHQEMDDFHGVHHGTIRLWALVMGLVPAGDEEELKSEAPILFGSYICMTFVTVFLVNMLIAQLSCSYGSTYQHMVGFARLKRIRLIVETMVAVSTKRWSFFVSSLGLDDKLEFNEGDVGVAGGIQIVEPASANPTTVDMIQRFGGSTSPEMQWPVTEGFAEDDEDKMVRLDKLIATSITRVAGGASSGKHTKKHTVMSSGSGGGSSGLASFKSSGYEEGTDGDD